MEVQRQSFQAELERVTERFEQVEIRSEMLEGETRALKTPQPT